MVTRIWALPSVKPSIRSVLTLTLTTPGANDVHVVVYWLSSKMLPFTLTVTSGKTSVVPVDIEIDVGSSSTVGKS